MQLHFLRPVFREEGVRIEQHVSQHHQETEHRTQHRAFLPEIIGAENDGHKIEIQEGDLVRDEIIQRSGRQQDEQHERMLEIAVQIAL